MVVSEKTQEQRGDNMDKAKLRYEMEKRGVSCKELCDVLRMSKSAFYRKCTGKSEFTQGEIQIIVDYLDLDTPVGIFLPKKCLKGNF
jgi:hypothetical protein